MEIQILNPWSTSILENWSSWNYKWIGMWEIAFKYTQFCIRKTEQGGKKGQVLETRRRGSRRGRSWCRDGKVVPSLSLSFRSFLSDYSHLRSLHFLKSLHQVCVLCIDSDPPLPFFKFICADMTVTSDNLKIFNSNCRYFVNILNTFESKFEYISLSSRSISNSLRTCDDGYQPQYFNPLVRSKSADSFFVCFLVMEYMGLDAEVVLFTMNSV